MARTDTEIRVAIVSPVLLLREGLSRLLAETDDIEVCGHGDRADGATKVLHATEPDVVLVDIDTRDDLDAARQWHRSLPETAFLALGVEEDPSVITGCAEAGIRGYVCRTASVADLIESIRAVAAGEMRCSPVVAAALMARVAELSGTRRVEDPGTATSLTQREHQILEQVALGLTNKEIARTLDIATATVRNHVHNILEKLGAHTRGEAVAQLLGPIGAPSRAPAAAPARSGSRPALTR